MPAIIFLNGNFPGKKVINSFLMKNGLIIAADGGGNSLKSIDILPDIVIGDLDSLSKSNHDYFVRKKVKINLIIEQETTDFEKCLLYCKKKNFKEIIVFGALSLRPDHTLNNFSVLKRYSKIFRIKFITDDFEILYVKNKIKFLYKK
nr:thiamine diphosphokinase [Ignavibacteria bacterium]